MKKIVILLTITCATLLTGMETKKTQSSYAGFGSRYVYDAVMPYIDNYDAVEDVILNIKVASLLGDEEIKRMINDEYTFTELTHVLADHFNLSTNTIAKNFEKTSAAKKYIELGSKLINALANKYTDKQIAFNEDVAVIKDLIAQGADVNYSVNYVTPLIIAIKSGASVNVIKLLLDSGANPLFKDKRGLMASEYVGAAYIGNPKKYQIREILKQAIDARMQ
jgi:hypothetical protein